MESTVDKIKVSNILKIKKHRYFNDTVVNYTKLNSLLYKNLVKLMLSAMFNKSLETLLIIDSDSMKSRTFTSHLNNNVDIPDCIIEKLNNTNDKTSFIMMHNHPNNTNFSIEDLNTFVSRPKISYLLVCTNDCKHIAIIGESSIINDTVRKKMLYVIEEYCKKNGLDEHSPADKLIQFFMTKGLLYAVYKNY